MSSQTPEEIKAKIREKVRKNLYNEKGVPFAPWIAKQIDEDVSSFRLFQKVIYNYHCFRQ